MAVNDTLSLDRSNAYSMNVLHIIPSFYPATSWGGPIISTFSLCNALNKIDSVSLTVLTTNSDRTAANNIISHEQISQINFPFRIKYCHRIAGSSVSVELLKLLKKKISWADVVHLTAVYSFPTIPSLFVARMLKKPVVWSPRGSLQRWKGQSKPYLKFCWDTLCKIIVDPITSCMHVTSLQEEKESKKVFPNFSYIVIKNGVEISDDIETGRQVPSSSLRILFIGRIHPIKGIENLLLALSRLSDIDYRLTVCGSGSQKYVNKIKALCTYCEIDKKIHFSGHVDGDKKKEAFINSDVCVVPSYTENFGMVVAEALAYSVPVICSKGAPWSDLMKYRCGIWTDNDPDSLSHAIRQISSMDMHAMGRRGQRLIEREYNWKKLAKEMSDQYRNLINKQLELK